MDEETRNRVERMTQEEKGLRLRELLEKDNVVPVPEQLNPLGDDPEGITQEEYEELQWLKRVLEYRPDIEDVRNAATKLPEYTHHKPYGGKSDLGEGVYGPTWVDRPDNPDDHE